METSTGLGDGTPGETPRKCTIAFYLGAAGATKIEERIEEADMRFAALALLFLLAAVPGLASPDETVVAPKETIPVAAPLVNLPATYENLAVYILENPKAKPLGVYVTLDEGLREGHVRVSEKRDAQVNVLEIDNGGPRPVYVQAGDIVHGGRQDRVIGADTVIPPHTPGVSVPSFCVEPNRWSGGTGFGSTTGLVMGAKLRTAILKEKNQNKVWDAVAEAKAALVSTNGLRESRSSSLNEQLLDQGVQRRLAAFSKVLGKALDKKDRAVGLVTAINGKLSSADIYGDPALFRKLYPRLLAAAALEAISTPSGNNAPPSVADAAKLLAAADGGRPAGDLREGGKTLQSRFLLENVEVHRQSFLK